MKRNVATVLLLVAGAVFLFGVVQLLLLRFEQGDVYPAYSSLRADPLGTMALYESLEGISGVTVSRDYSTANKLPAGPSTTYLYLAAPMRSWNRLPRETVLEIERFAASGGRLVVALYPGIGLPRLDAEPPPKDRKPPPETEEEKKKSISIKERWSVDFKLVPLTPGGDGKFRGVPVRRSGDAPVPEEVMWHSGVVMTNLAPVWSAVYAGTSGTVVAERIFGKGSIVFATDSYFLSNEALQRDRNAGLLAWLIGSNREVVFGEAHLGVTETPGVATLIRRYRLHGLVGALLLLAALFVWKNAFSLLPRAIPDSSRRIAGKDAVSGFVNLLRRSVKPKDLLAVCFSEWKASVPSATYSAARRESAEAVFREEALRTGNDRDPVRAYKTIAATLNSRQPAQALQGSAGQLTDKPTT